jgi:uncharacterized protein YneF (UPF0154 family)
MGPPIKVEKLKTMSEAIGVKPTLFRRKQY